MYYFIKIILILFTLTFFSKDKSLKNDKPNFIIYLSDDQDFLDYNIFGNENVQSIGVNKLAKEGITFTNFHTGQAICCLLYTSDAADE